MPSAAKTIRRRRRRTSGAKSRVIANNNNHYHHRRSYKADLRNSNWRRVSRRVRVRSVSTPPTICVKWRSNGAYARRSHVANSNSDASNNNKNHNRNDNMDPEPRPEPAKEATSRRSNGSARCNNNDRQHQCRRNGRKSSRPQATP